MTSPTSLSPKSSTGSKYSWRLILCHASQRSAMRLGLAGLTGLGFGAQLRFSPVVRLRCPRTSCITTSIWFMRSWRRKFIISLSSWIGSHESPSSSSSRSMGCNGAEGGILALAFGRIVVRDGAGGAVSICSRWSCTKRNSLTCSIFLLWRNVSVNPREVLGFPGLSRQMSCPHGLCRTRFSPVGVLPGSCSWPCWSRPLSVSRSYWGVWGDRPGSSNCISEALDDMWFTGDGFGARFRAGHNWAWIAGRSDMVHGFYSLLNRPVLIHAQSFPVRSWVFMADFWPSTWWPFWFWHDMNMTSSLPPHYGFAKDPTGPSERVFRSVSRIGTVFPSSLNCMLWLATSMTAPKDLKTLLAIRKGVLFGTMTTFNPLRANWEKDRTATDHCAIIAKSKTHGTRGFLHRSFDMFGELPTQVLKLLFTYHWHAGA